MKKTILIIMLSLLTYVGCSESEDVTNVPGPPEPLTYKTDLKPIFDGQCISCHSGVSPLGSYDLSTYAGVFGNGKDATPNAIPGDATSKIVVMTQGGHPSIDADRAEIIRKWVVDDNCEEGLSD